jgi:perosamine synthetase
MSRLIEYSYCGPPGLTYEQLFGFIQSNNALKWFDGTEVHFLHKGRTGIRRACDLLGIEPGTEVLAPSYNCGSEIDALLHSGTRVVPYRVTRDCSVDFADLRGRITRKTRAIYVTHYFGFSQPIDDVWQLCSEQGLYLIEDCALALFSLNGNHKKIGRTGDLSVFSLPKTLPVPDGGVLVINNPTLCSASWRLTPPRLLGVARRMVSLAKASILKGLSRMPGIRQAVWLFLELLGRSYRPVARRTRDQRPDMPADYYYDETMTDKALSNVTAKMMTSFQIDHVRERRRTNYSLYLSGICDFASLRPLFPELPSGVCPLNFPVIVDNRSRLCAALNQRGIAAIGWWAGYHRGLAWEQHPDACFLKDHVLALPVHQSLDEKNIAYIIKTLAELIG